MAEKQSGTFLSEQDRVALHTTVWRLLKSELYLQRLRRALMKHHDSNVLSDFITLDDVILAAWQYVFRSEVHLSRERGEVFLTALNGVEDELFDDAYGCARARELVKCLRVREANVGEGTYPSLQATLILEKVTRRLGYF